MTFTRGINTSAQLIIARFRALMTEQPIVFKVMFVSVWEVLAAQVIIIF